MCLCHGVKEGSVYPRVTLELFHDSVLITGVGAAIAVIAIEDLPNSAETRVLHRTFDIIYSCSLHLWLIY